MNHPSELSPFNARESLIKQTVAQIDKDFSMFGMEITFPTQMEMAYPEVFAQLQYHLDDMMSAGSGRLSALLYHIDLPEATIMDVWNQHPEQSRAAILSELIIVREFKKVVYRNFYRETNKTGKITP